MPAKAHIQVSDDQISEALVPFEIFPSEVQINQIREYLRLLLKWNELISLTSIADPIEILRRHFGESMYASILLPVENCRLADVGSGAGFPGLALKIACSDIRLILIESSKKKCAFLSEVVTALELRSVEVRPERFEQIAPEAIEANVITSRAVGGFHQMLRWSKRALTHRGHVVLWVGGEDSTRIAQSQAWTWQPAIRIPDSQHRFILIGRPA